MSTVLIDGSVLEGGGQIVRGATALAAILDIPRMQIINIRRNRSTPGLKAQHIAGIELISNISRRRLLGCCLNSMEVELAADPDSRCHTVNYLESNAGTAGSISLIAQSALSVLLVRSSETDSPITLKLQGGSDVSMSPPMDHTKNVLAPLLHQMGLSIAINIQRRGFYPVGGGVVEIIVAPCASMCLRPLVHAVRGSVLRVHGTITCSHESTASIKFYKECLESRLIQIGFDPHTTDLQISQYLGDSSRSSGKSARKANKKETLSVQLWLEMSCGSVLSANSLVTTARSDGQSVAPSDLPTAWHASLTQLMEHVQLLLSSGACVDEHTADQLLLYMALADGRSELLCAPALPSVSSLHMLTMIHVVESVFSQINADNRPIFDVRTVENGCRLISCVGIGLKLKK